MGVVEDFIKMVETERRIARKISLDESYILSERFIYDNRWDALNDVIDSPEYKALKATIDKQKLVVTDDLQNTLNVALKNVTGQCFKEYDLEYVLQAVFDMVNGSTVSNSDTKGDNSTTIAKEKQSAENAQSKCNDWLNMSPQEAINEETRFDG